MVSLITRGIREFVARNWDEARRSKDLYWRDRIERLGPGEAFRIAEELRRQMGQRDPAWPTAALRRKDLRAHARLARLLRRADAARRG